MSFSNAAVFERAMATMQTEWRRFEQERAEWDVERIRLKAKLSAAEKRIEQLGSLYRVSQKHITALEHLLSEARSGNAPGDESTLSSSNSRPSEGEVTIEQMVSVTKNTRQRSRELLGRCLGEIEILLGNSSAPCISPAPSPSIAENLRMSANSSTLAQGVTLLKREQPPPAVPNGVIESEAHNGWQRLVSPPPLYTNIIDHSELATFHPPPPLRGECDEEEEEGEEDNVESAAPLAAAAKAESAEVAAESATAMEDLAPEKRPIRKIAERRRRSSQLASSPVLAPIGGLAQRRMSATPSDAESELAPITAGEGGGWQATKTFMGHMDGVRALHLRSGSEGLQAVSGGDDGMVVLWDVERSDRRKSRRQRSHGDVVPAAILRAHRAAVTAVACADAHPFAYSAALDARIHVWPLLANDDACFPVRTFDTHTDAVWDLALAPNAELLASVAADAKCCVWSTASDAPLRATFARAAAVVPTSTCFADASLAVAYVDGTVDLYDVASETRLVADMGALPESRITKVAAAEHTLAVACVNGDVRLVDTRAKGNTCVRAYGGAAAATAVDLSDDLLVTGGSDGVVKWWDRRSLRTSIHEDAAHTPKGDEGVGAIHIYSSSSVATAGGDGLAKLYTK
ncbi:1,2-dihydroxy-3-keto-5-methylthiopentene dioxygenase [Coemansia furcata]|uniref:1,2-dihydroxy-3-keto-5-methylthiopentene dioxygenase n=1 Tax=Coemansia furcata TaxID=417177 RepID=A0ACC1LNR6_9FUNG|nr:1,2-dihydroxy-3-keto-5-methylthiopentene dioxygenase [Coemansia furcata]